MSTFARFRNVENGVEINIPMPFETENEALSVPQRQDAYEKLSQIVSEDFLHNCVLNNLMAAD